QPAGKKAAVFWIKNIDITPNDDQYILDDIFPQLRSNQDKKNHTEKGIGIVIKKKTETQLNFFFQ
ncbi:MAG TPA: hypothetical protein DCP78_16435, partial [Sphingobacterium sp.]|nr:hypothetical protein [Sphingobacterium sp.]